MKRLTSFLLPILFILLLSNQLIADTPADDKSGVKGKVVDRETKAILEYATVMVFRQVDSTFVLGGITDEKGVFNLSVEPGNYYLMIDFLGYHRQYRNNIVVNEKKTIDVGNILVSPDSMLLGEVEVVAEKSTLEMTLDKRVFNIGKDVSSTAGNAIEVLESIPSVAVDIDGNVSLRGDEGVRILIDGKVSGLAGISSNDALKSLQADMIDRIEIVTNPSVRYDAEGTAGIINIILKKDKRRGFNGAIDLTAGYPEQYGAGLSANYRIGKLNLFGNYSINYRNREGGGDYYREMYRPDGTYKTFQDSERLMKRLNNTFRLGAEYSFTEKDVLSLSFLYRYADGENESTVTYRDLLPDDIFDSQSDRIDTEDDKSPTLEYTLNYRKDFARKGQNLTANIRYYNNEEDERSMISETNYMRSNNVLLPEWQKLQKINNDQLDKNLQATVDYVHPLWRKGVFEAGLKYQWREIDNNYDSFEQDENGVYQPMEAYTNHFLYDEQITAGYLILGNDFGRYSFQAGLRGEYSDIQTILKETDVKNTQNYFDLFPSLHLNYKLTENDQLQLSYSRRIRRPFYRQLNPFHSLSDNRNVRTGNPHLKPVFTDSYEFGYLRYWNKASLNVNLYYRHSVDVFRQMTTLDTLTGITYTMPWNFGSEDSYGLEIVGSVNPLKWLNVNGNFNLFQSVTVGDFNGTHYTTEYLGYGARLVAKFNITKGFDAQLSGNYRGPRENPQGKSKADYWADLGVSKEVFKGKGTLTLNVRDVFGTRGFKNEIFDANYYQKTTFKWSRTTVTLNFNYRINQQKRQRRNNEMQRPTDTDMMDDGMMDI